TRAAEVVIRKVLSLPRKLASNSPASSRASVMPAALSVLVAFSNVSAMDSLIRLLPASGLGSIILAHFLVSGFESDFAAKSQEQRTRGIKPSPLGDLLPCHSAMLFAFAPCRKNFVGRGKRKGSAIGSLS